MGNTCFNNWIWISTWCTSWGIFLLWSRDASVRRTKVTLESITPLSLTRVNKTWYLPNIYPPPFTKKKTSVTFSGDYHYQAICQTFPSPCIKLSEIKEQTPSLGSRAARTFGPVSPTESRNGDLFPEKKSFRFFLLVAYHRVAWNWLFKRLHFINCALHPKINTEYRPFPQKKRASYRIPSLCSNENGESKNLLFPQPFDQHNFTLVRTLPPIIIAIIEGINTSCNPTYSPKFLFLSRM